MLLSRQMKTIAAILGVVGLVSGCAGANDSEDSEVAHTDRTAWHVSSFANAETGWGSEDAPLRYLQDAVDRANDNDLILVCGTMSLNETVAIDKPLTIVASVDCKWDVDHSHRITMSALVVQNAFVRMQNFDVRGHVYVYNAQVLFDGETMVAGR